MYEIRIHCRGGEGGVTAARLIALAAFRDGRYAMAWPFYGAERRGAPVVSYVRIDDRPIRMYSQIRNPDLVVVLDPTVMDVVDVYHGLKPGGVVLINAPGAVDVPGHRTYAVDLTGIALALNLVIAGSPILDTSVVGAVAKLGIVTMDSGKRAVTEMFPDERNVRAAEAAYRELVV
jgi:pyruvate ferredoxin oxidoreductase gamma subunit